MEYMPEPYLDYDSNVKALVLRKATPEELKMMQQMRAGGGPDMSALNETESSPLLDQPAPLFEIKDLTGKTVHLEALKGKVVVLNFWFVECKPCVSEIPELNELVFDFQKEDIVFMALALKKKKSSRRRFVYLSSNILITPPLPSVMIVLVFGELDNFMNA